MMMNLPDQPIIGKRRYNHSIVIARTQEGTLLRRIDALEYETLDLEMPIGAYAWQEEFQEMIVGTPGRHPVRKWRFTVDQGRYTFRHYDFAIPVKVGHRFHPFMPGETGSALHFPKIGAFVETKYREYLYVRPREFIDVDTLKQFKDPSVLWFFAQNQDPCDSFEYNPGLNIKNYLEFRPADTNQRNLTTTYALCSHRSDLLTTWNGGIPLEKGKKLEIGSWYTCQYSPKIVAKCCSIQPYKASKKPVETWMQTYYDHKKKTEKKLVMCRDFIPVPEMVTTVLGGDVAMFSIHPLLHRVHFPLYCDFLQTEGVEVCFAREEYVYPEDNKWRAVAVNNGYGMYWLPVLPPQLKDIIRKEEFPFIKSLTAVEAEHYGYISDQYSFDDINSYRVEYFKEASQVVIEYDKPEDVPEKAVEPKVKPQDRPLSGAVELFD